MLLVSFCAQFYSPSFSTTFFSSTFVGWKRASPSQEDLWWKCRSIGQSLCWRQGANQHRLLGMDSSFNAPRDKTVWSVLWKFGGYTEIPRRPQSLVFRGTRNVINAKLYASYQFYFRLWRKLFSFSKTNKRENKRERIFTMVKKLSGFVNSFWYPVYLSYWTIEYILIYALL